MDGGGHGHLGQSRSHELEERHLGRGVLHGHAIGLQVEVALPPQDLGLIRVIQVAVDDLLRQGERPVQPLAHHLQAGGHVLVGGLDERGSGVDLGHGKTLLASAV